MTTAQVLSFAIIGAMLVLFLWERLRYDLVAALALLAAVAAGVVPADKAFDGFANPVVVVIACAFVLSRAISRSGILEPVIRRLAPLMRTRDLQVSALVLPVMIFSAFMKNDGTLTIFMPVAHRLARRTGRSVSEFLMPMSFASLIGGIVTLIGTSPNLLISSVRQNLLGEPYSVFDFAPVGIGICVVGALFLSAGWRLVSAKGRQRAAADEKFHIEDYTTEVCLPKESPYVGREVGDLEKLGDGDLAVVAIVREHGHRYIPNRHWTLYANDLLVLEADPIILKRVIDEARLVLAPSKGPPVDEHDQETLATVEAVVSEGSPMINQSPESLQLRQRHNINLLAVRQRGGRLTSRL